MPRSTKLIDFGQEFEVLLTRAHKELARGKDVFSIDFATPELAHALRFRIYGYFKALRTSLDRPDLTAMCTGLSMRTVGCAVHFYRRGDDKESAALRDALGIDRTPPITTPSTLDSNLELLRHIRRSKD